MELLDRYLTSVQQELPADKQSDIIRELKANILDEVESLEASGQTRQEALPNILLKYGHPVATAQRFSPQAPLVSGEDIPFYKAVLLHGAVLIFVLSLLQSLTSMLMEDSINPIRLLFQTFGNFLDHASFLLLVVTVIFYYLGKDGTLAKWRYKGWTLAKLPPFPGAKISLTDTFTDITSASFYLLILWTSLWMSEEGLQSLFIKLSPQSEYWRVILTILSLLSLLFALLRLSQTSWQKWSLIAYIADYMLFAIAFLWMASEPNLLVVSNPEVAQNWPFVVNMIEVNFQYFLVFTGILLAILGLFQVRKLVRLNKD